VNQKPKFCDWIAGFIGRLFIFRQRRPINWATTKPKTGNMQQALYGKNERLEVNKFSDISHSTSHELKN
jgi:hypothetical protein